MSCPNPTPTKPNTIRMTVEVEIPYDLEVVQYVDKGKQKIINYINSDKFQSYEMIIGPHNEERKSTPIRKSSTK